MQPLALAAHRGIFKAFAVDFEPGALEEDLLISAEKEIAPQHLVLPDYEVRLLIAPGPGEGRGPVVSQPLFPKRHLPELHHQPQRSVARARADQRPEATGEVRRLSVERRDREAQQHPRHRPADGDFVRDDEVLEVDERGDDEERRHDPIRKRQHPRMGRPARRSPRPHFPPHGEKEQPGEQLHAEVAEGNPRAAIRALSAQDQPGEQRDIVVQRDLIFAGRTKRALRLIDRQAQRHAVDADVEEGADARPEDERERGEKSFVKRREHRRDGKQRAGAASMREPWMASLPACFDGGMGPCSSALYAQQAAG